MIECKVRRTVYALILFGRQYHMTKILLMYFFSLTFFNFLILKFRTFSVIAWNKKRNENRVNVTKTKNENTA